LLPFLLLVLGGIAGGCANPVGPAWDDTIPQHELWTKAPEDFRIDTLRSDLQRVCPKADPEEIAAVAGAAIRFGERVRVEYGLFRPVEINNILIQMGLKRRGLCFQLADDLFCRLRAMELKTLDLHEGQAAVGDLIEEHNCVVVTDKGAPFQSGIVLDAWRYAGKLRWLPLSEDTHDWKERPTKSPAGDLVFPDYATVASAPVHAAVQRKSQKPFFPDPDDRGSDPCKPR
jgi:hypothetical protein